MNKSLIEIIQYLIHNSNRSVLISALADRFKVTERSVRNYLESLEGIMKELGLEECLYQKGGFVILQLSREQERQLDSYIKNIDYYNYRLSAEERQLVIIFLLLTSHTFVTLDTLSELLCVSKSTVYNDVRSVMDFFDGEGISINEKKVKGYCLETDERTRRELMLKVLEERGFLGNDYPSDSGNVFLQFVVKHYLKLDLFYRSVQAAIYVSANHYGVSVPDKGFRELTLVICIVLARCSEGHMLETAGSLREGLYYDIARKAVELSYSKPLDEKELSYIAEKISTVLNSVSREVEEKEEINYYFVVKSFLNKVSFESNAFIFTDIKLQEFLTMHLYQIHNRLVNNESLVNPYKDDLLREYQDVYQVIKNNIHIIEKVLQCSLSDDEISFILMHVVAAMERLKQDSVVFNIAVVCDTGLGTSSFLVERLKKHYSFNVAKITSSRDFIASLFNSTLQDQEYDFVLSTVYLGDIPVNWIQVTPLLNDHDIQKIDALLEEVTVKKMTRLQDSYYEDVSGNAEQKKNVGLDFAEYFHHDCIMLNMHAADWKEAVRLTAQPLIFEGTITEEYIQDIYNNVEHNGPYFVLSKGVAIAHSYSENGVRRFGVSLACFDDGICFGSENDPVRIVVIMAIVKSEEVRDLLFTLMNALCNEEVKQHLLRAENYEDIIRYLNWHECARGRQTV